MPGYNDTSMVKENIPKTPSVVLRLSCRVANFIRFALYNLNVPENMLILRITPHVYIHETHYISERRPIERRSSERRRPSERRPRMRNNSLR